MNLPPLRRCRGNKDKIKSFSEVFMLRKFDNVTKILVVVVTTKSFRLRCRRKASASSQEINGIALMITKLARGSDRDLSFRH